MIFVVVYAMMMGSVRQILCEDHSSVLLVGKVLWCLQMGFSLVMVVVSGRGAFFVGDVLLLGLLLLLVLLEKIFCRCLICVLWLFLLFLRRSCVTNVSWVRIFLLVVDLMLLLALLVLVCLLLLVIIFLMAHLTLRLLIGDVMSLVVFVDSLTHLCSGLVFSLQVLLGTLFGSRRGWIAVDGMAMMMFLVL